MDKNKVVLDFINDNFEPGSVTVEDFPGFPFGKQITDRNGDKMLVYFDLLTDSVKWVYPD